MYLLLSWDADHYIPFILNLLWIPKAVGFLSTESLMTGCILAVYKFLQPFQAQLIMLARLLWCAFAGNECDITVHEHDSKQLPVFFFSNKVHSMKELSYTGHMWFVFKCVCMWLIFLKLTGFVPEFMWVLDISTGEESLRICCPRKEPWLLKHCREQSKANTVHILQGSANSRWLQAEWTRLAAASTGSCTISEAVFSYYSLSALGQPSHFCRITSRYTASLLAWFMIHTSVWWLKRATGKS